MFQITMGTVDSFVKRMQLQQKWTLKKSQAVFMLSKPEKLSAMDQEQKSRKLDAITNKLKSGKKLSASEMEYLRANAPGLYAKAVKVKLEREGFERELKRCRTKDEVNRLIMQKTGSILSEISKIDSSGMDDAGKLAAYDFAAMRMSAVEDVYHVFISKGGLHRLPKNEEERREGNEPEKTEPGEAEESPTPDESGTAQAPDKPGDAADAAGEPTQDTAEPPQPDAPQPANLPQPDAEPAPFSDKAAPAPSPAPEPPADGFAASAKKGFSARA